MEIFHNPTPELIISYLTNLVLLIVTGATLVSNSRSNKKNRESAKELEILKSELELAREYQKEKIAHVRRLLNYVYTIRTAADEAIHGKPADELINALTTFKNYYRSTADKTNVLEVVVRNYAHDIFIHHGRLEHYLKNLKNRPAAPKDEIESIYLDISRFSKIYEDVLRSDLRELTPYHA